MKEHNYDTFDNGMILRLVIATVVTIGMAILGMIFCI